MKPIRLVTPLTGDLRAGLRVGDEVLLSGVLFTARDAAHRKFAELLQRGKRLPSFLNGSCIFYAGPTPAVPGMAVGSCGPTTSSRMDRFTPALLAAGVVGFIGKGGRDEKVRRALMKYKGVYFLAIGGAGALIATKIRTARTVLYKDLGPEAVYRLEVEDLPLIVGIDMKGNDIYKTNYGVEDEKRSGT